MFLAGHNPYPKRARQLHLAHSGSQSQREIRFIPHARGASRIIIVVNVWVLPFGTIYMILHQILTEYSDIPRSEQRKIVNFECVQGQISKRIFAPNAHLQAIVFINLQTFFATNLGIWEYCSDISQFQLQNIQSHDTFRPIVRERKFFNFFNFLLFDGLQGGIITTSK